MCAGNCFSQISNLRRKNGVGVQWKPESLLYQNLVPFSTDSYAVFAKGSSRASSLIMSRFLIQDFLFSFVFLGFCWPNHGPIIESVRCGWDQIVAAQIRLKTCFNKVLFGYFWIVYKCLEPGSLTIFVTFSNWPGVEVLSKARFKLPCHQEPFLRSSHSFFHYVLCVQPSAAP